MYLVICLISLFLSIPGFVRKAGIPSWKAFIPILNVYYFFKLTKISPILLILLSLGLIFWEERLFILTVMCIFFPFILSETYGYGKKIGFLGLIAPFVIYPWLAYRSGIYIYEEENNAIL